MEKNTKIVKQSEMMRRLRIKVRAHVRRTRSGKLVRIRSHYRLIPDKGKPGKGKKVIKIKRPGLLNSISLKLYGKTFTKLSRSQMKEVLKRVKRMGYTEKQMIGMMQAQVTFRKRQRNGVKRKFEIAREIVAHELCSP